jgi:hypothetical protein
MTSLKNFITILFLVQEVRKFTYKSAVVIIIEKHVAMMKLFQLQSKAQEQVFAFQIARHLAITINELLMYTTSLFFLIELYKLSLPSAALFLVIL